MLGLTQIERMTASNIPNQPDSKTQPNGLARKQSSDTSTPGLLRQLNEQRQSLEQELSTFRSSLLGREVIISNYNISI